MVARCVLMVVGLAVAKFIKARRTSARERSPEGRGPAPMRGAAMQ